MALLMLTSVLLFPLLTALLLKSALSSAPPSHVPKTHPIIGCLISFHRNRRRLLHWYTDLLAASPSQTITVSRLGGRRSVVTANPSNVRHILSTNFANYPKGKPFSNILGDLLGGGIFNSDGHLWSSQRKLASRSFTLRSIRSLVADVLTPEMDARFLPALAAAAERGREVVLDLQDILRGFSFRAICRTTLGPLPPPMELAEALDAATEISARRGATSMSLVWKVKRALGLGSERRLREAVDFIRRTVRDVISAGRSRKGDGDSSLLARLIEEGYKDEEIGDMAISFLIAGRDTTSAALTWFFWLVSTHPEVERRITAELGSTVGSGEVNYERLKEMKYLEASLTESMRLYPPVAWDSKYAVCDDALPDGTAVRAGDRVTYFPYGMGRMEGLWGRDWAEFRPERWMAEGGSMARVSPYSFPVFQAGPRVCLGRDMAMVQMKFVGASVLRRFEVRWMGRDAPVMVPLLTAHMAGGLPVMVRERGLRQPSS